MDDPYESKMADLAAELLERPLEELEDMLAVAEEREAVSAPILRAVIELKKTAAVAHAAFEVAGIPMGERPS